MFYFGKHLILNNILNTPPADQVSHTDIISCFPRREIPGFYFLCVSVSEFAQTICKTSLMDIVTFIFQVYFMYLWMI